MINSQLEKSAIYFSFLYLITFQIHFTIWEYIFSNKNDR